MTYLKKITTTVVLLFSMLASKANSNPFNVFVQSTTHTVLAGSVTYTAYLVALDTLTLDTGFTYEYSRIDLLTGDEAYGTTTGMMPGDTVFYQFTIEYDTNALAYYPLGLMAFKNIITKYGDTLKAEFWAHLFFTPWNEIEIWNHEEFTHCGRLWKNESEDSNAVRVYIPKNSLPTSTWEEPDTSSAEWEEVPQYRVIPDLPYHIKMAAIHPDTLVYYDDTYGDSIPENFNMGNAFFVGPRYYGTIRGRLVYRIENDLGQFIDSIPLSGILVQLKESDLGDNVRIKIAETHTDENGIFNLQYDTRQPFEGGSIELFLHILSMNKYYNFKVKEPYILGYTALIGNVEEQFIDIADQGEGNAGIVDLGDFHIDNKAMHVTNWVEKAFRYTNQQGLNVALGGSNYLTILTNVDNTMMLPNSILHIDNFWPVWQLRTDPVIRLSRFDTEHENTIYHEWGHFFMWKLQNKNFITRYDDAHCFWEAVNDNDFFGVHYWDQEQQMRMAWTEGFANAIAFILDAVYWEEDQEYGWPNTGVIGRPRKNHHEMRFPESNISNGLKSEYFIACSIFDMWDGSNKGLPNPNVTGLPGAGHDQNLPSNAHPFNDCLIKANSTDPFVPLNTVTFDWQSGPDDVELSFYDLMQPVDNGGITDKIHNINEYAQYLLNDVYADDCEARNGIGRCLKENRILLDIHGYETNTPSSRLDFNTSITTDEIYENVDFNDRGIDIACMWHDDEIVYARNPIETAANQVTAIPNTAWVAAKKALNPSTFPILTNTDITDDLRLGYNFPDAADKTMLNINTNSDYPYNIELNTCHNILWQFGNTEVNFGTTSGKTSIIHFNNGSILSLENNSILRINNNSKLIIEEGATLHIFSGTRIILNGSNSVLEIKGTLNVHTNATFTFEGGSAGSGHVIFNTTDKNNIILGNNSKIRFAGAGSTDKVMEVPANKTFWPDNIQPTQTGGYVSSSFEVQNGLVALGEDAWLNIGTAVTLSGVHFYANPDYKARGIVMWGQKNSLSAVEVENVAGGIQSFNSVGGYNLKMEYVTVSGANKALLSVGKGSTLDHFESDGNNFGIDINGSVLPNTFYSPNVHGAESFATFYTGSSASNLVINNPDYNENLDGISFIGEGSLVVNCGRIHNQAGASGGTARNGITQKSGNLILTDALGYLGGRVSFADNKNSIELTETKFYLNNGYNDLSFITTSNGVNLALKGTSSHKAGTLGTIKADYNLWDNTSSSYYWPITSGSPLPSPPWPYQNYNVIAQINSGGGLYIPGSASIPNSPYLTPSGFTTERTNRCTNGSGVGADKGTKASTKMINTTHFTNKNLQEAVDEVIDDMYPVGLVPNYTELIGLWAEILTEPTYLSPYEEDDYYYIDLAENKMMEALGLLLGSDTTLELSQSSQTHFATILDVQDEWITAVENDTTDLGVSLKNIFNFDKGVLYHLEGENSMAQAQWTNMQTWASEEYMEHTDYWLCQLTMEAALKNCGNNPDSLPDILVCQYADGENAFRLSDTYGDSKEKLPQIQQLKKENKISKHLNLYPNPASTIVTAELETSQKGEASINIYSADGKHIKTLPSTRLNLGINKLMIPVSDLTTGVYTIAIETRNIKWNEKVIIE